MSIIRAQAYTNAGVNINTGNAFVSHIKPFIKATKIPGVLSDLGGFCGLFKPDLSNISSPVLISSTDGVGTKLKLAVEFGKHDTIGIDLVAMCVNDILVQGARPLFFLDYFATSQLNITIAQQVISGIAEGCKQAACALLGGETAELPDMYKNGEYDLAGFCVGIADQSALIDGSSIKVGDVILGLSSSGLHSNGYSLVRNLFEQSNVRSEDTMPGSEQTFKEALLTPTVIYVKIIEKIIQTFSVNGMVHITGGGFFDNIPRILPQSVIACIDFGSWDIHPIFHWLRKEGKLSWFEMLQIFNCGIGYILIVSNKIFEQVRQVIQDMDMEAWVIGSIKERVNNSEQVIVENC